MLVLTIVASNANVSVVEKPVVMNGGANVAERNVKDVMFSKMISKVHGMKITNASPNDNKGRWIYEVVGLNHPHVFHKKMYMNPIPQSVRDQNKEIVQNPGYQ